MAKYFERVAEFMLPFVANRPLAILRAPAGRSGGTGLASRRENFGR
jgi:DNA primase